MYNIIFYRENGVVLINFDTDLQGARYVYNILCSNGTRFLLIAESLVNKNSISQAVIYDKDGNKTRWANIV